MKLACAIEDCGIKVHARGWCQKHYYRWRRTGDPLGLRPRLYRRGERKTHCKQGHQFIEGNVRLRTVGAGTVQVCKTCNREGVRRVRARQAAGGAL